MLYFYHTLLLQAVTKLKVKGCHVRSFYGHLSQSLMIAFFVNFLQFRLAYVAPETRVAGAGDLVDHPKRIFLHYLRGYFLLDLLVAVPLPQVSPCFSDALTLICFSITLIFKMLQLYE